MLTRFWHTLPPPFIQLKRIALALGIPEPKPMHTSANPGRPSSAEEALREAIAAGLPVMDGRPDDPMLAFLDI